MDQCVMRMIPLPGRFACLYIWVVPSHLTGPISIASASFSTKDQSEEKPSLTMNGLQCGRSHVRTMIPAEFQLPDKKSARMNRNVDSMCKHTRHEDGDNVEYTKADSHRKYVCYSGRVRNTD
uniref:Uncharacterized protein n=1 Tax=Pristionchus pacificus TaxID=54126 RepID=A0A2A6C150_PRIPA|eukprot:PDM71895.1 hypothetical protein PRIPAC_38302 [Pristionchus pacificus]